MLSQLHIILLINEKNSLYVLNLYLKLISMIQINILKQNECVCLVYGYSHVESNLNLNLSICLVRFAKYCYISGQLVVPNVRLSKQ